MAIDTGEVLDFVQAVTLDPSDHYLEILGRLLAQQISGTWTSDGHVAIDLSDFLTAPLVVAVAAISRLAEAQGESVEKAILGLRVDLFDWSEHC